jgi:uncharacterized protein YjbI with pentapeptide repeats
MANEQHVEILRQGVEAWNAWRLDSPEVELDLVGANFSRANLYEANLHGANLSRANLYEANLHGANLSRANLSGADLIGANLQGANLQEADLQGANLSEADLRLADLVGADLREANLSRADLSMADLSWANLSKASLRWANFSRANLSWANFSRANLEGAILVRTLLQRANLSNCRVYGLSAWDVALDATTQQHDLVITPLDQPSITVDNLEVAQFIYLLLRNEKVRHVIDTITSKVVLILGRFSNEQKPVLDEIRAKLREKALVPVLFDFDKPSSKDVTGTVETLARMARFIIADLTDPSSIPHELATLVPFMRTTPVVPIRLKGSGGYSMFDDFERSYDKWVLPKYEYEDATSLIENLEEKVIAPARARADQLQGRAGDSNNP